jgi:hypothetical protein
MISQDYSGLESLDFLDFPEENGSLYMTLPQSGYGISDIFSHSFG